MKNKLIFIIALTAGIAFADEIDAEIINDLEFFDTLEIVENMEQFQSDEIIENIPIENSQTPQEVGNE